MHKQSIKFTSSTFSLSVLYLYDNNVHAVINALYKKINDFPLFFRNTPIVINVSKLSNTVNWIKMKKSILSLGFYIIGCIDCYDDILKNKIIDSGISILSKNNTFIDNSKNHLLEQTLHSSQKYIINTCILDKPVRSGQKIYAQKANLVVTNNVSVGAELIADGNIHIYGVMRGRVLAGASGDIRCKIFCTELLAELVSISGQYWLIDQIPSHCLGKDVQVFLKNSVLNIKRLS
ncbi:MAG TPA: septum site-determining protein MinC [Buchnera sp. (in: enterobacteria)]|nr:septum site-determining protein MinC [Buchnera sp. (in: enterobacteria)]